MLDVGFLPDLRRIVRLLPTQRQTMLFSATFPAEIISLANEVTRNAAHVSVAKTVTPKAINQASFPVPEHAKLDVLKQLLREEEMRSVWSLRARSTAPTGWPSNCNGPTSRLA